MKTLKLKDTTEVKSQILDELNALEVKTNEYGDYVDSGDKTHVKFPARHNRGCKTTEIVGWLDYRPKKRTIWISTKKIEKLCDKLDEMEEYNKKAEENNRVIVLGYSNIKEYKASEKIRIAQEHKEYELRMEEARKKKYQQDTSFWEPVVKVVLENRKYDFPLEYAIEKVIEKIDENEGVGEAWNAGSAWEDNRFAHHDDASQIQFCLLCIGSG